MARQKVIPYIGGEWHGEGKEAPFNILTAPDILTDVGMPPKYIGNNHYDAYASHVKHEPYFLRRYDEKFYYVAESWLEGFPTNLDFPCETSNSMRIRQEKEDKYKNDMASKISSTRNALIDCVIEKHEAEDKDEKMTFTIKEALERTIYIAYRDLRIILDSYKGEPPMPKKRLKV